MRLPKVICSSVIRSAYKGQSHGGCYIVDLDTGQNEKVLDWNCESIDWQGRGGDRGLRGIGFYKNNILLAASDEIMVYDKNFSLIESYRNRYLKHCHEIFVNQDILYLTSCGFDSILEFDLAAKQFRVGYHVHKTKLERYLGCLGIAIKPNLKEFDPNTENGPKAGDYCHINNVFQQNNNLFFSGTGIKHLCAIKDHKLYSYGRLPFKTHNARPFRDGILANDTASHRVVYMTRNSTILKALAIKTYDDKHLLNTDLPEDYARQAFGRGLCVFDDLIIGGSSPATISAYSFEKTCTIKTVNITMDVRNAVHGLEIWPY